MKNESDKKLEEAILEINKKYGDNSIIVMDELKKDLNIEAISTGSVSLDKVFGCGGLPRGRMVEIFGVESSGKSTLAMFIVGQLQKEGKKAFWIDAEFSFSREYAEKLGINISQLMVAQPETGEEALDMVNKIASTSAVDIIVVDSVAALIPKKEKEGEITDCEMAQQARMMSKGMRYINSNLSNSKTAVIWINQEREKIGIFFGKKSTTTGGKALKYYASVRLEVMKGELIKNKKDEVIGNHMKICAVKNKVGLPWRRAELELIYENGIDLIGETLDLGIKNNIIEQNGHTFSFKDIKLGVGRDATKKFLEKDLKLYDEIKRKISEV